MMKIDALPCWSRLCWWQLCWLQLGWLQMGLLLLAMVPSIGSATETRPNVLYIFADDHSARTLSCYADMPDAYRWAQTPNLDQLAREGVRFSACYTGAKCVPSRGTALTGRLQGGYTPETPYWPTALREQRYVTGMCGKWHWNVPRHGDAWDWSVVWPHHLGDSSEEGDGSDYYYNQRVSIQGGPLVPLGGYSTDRYVDCTVEFLNERAGSPSQPWFFWLCFSGVHGPYTPADRHLDEYAHAPATDIPVDIFGPRPEKPEHDVHFTRWTKGANGEPVYKGRSFDAWVKQYNQAVRALDEGVGRIMQTLRDNGQSENTIVIFTADQGFAWGQHGYRDKLAPYDANLLAPLIVWNPGRFPQGAVCHHPVSGTDIVATMQKLAGLDSQPSDGRDFSALLADPSLAEWTEQPLLLMYTNGHYGNDQLTDALTKARASGDWSPLIAEKQTGIRSWLMMREGRYKYVRYLYADYIEELFDLEADPAELTNLALRQEHHSLLAAFRTKLVDAFAARGATYLDLLPEPRILDRPPVPESMPVEKKSKRKKR
jgi:arylsulfatase A-like enzyme